MNAPTLLIIATVIILVFSLGFFYVNVALEVNALGNRIEDCLIASGWAGFSQIDLNEFARRKVISSEIQRSITLNKTAAISMVEQYIRENMKLSDTYYPQSDSFIQEKDNPVKLDEITVYNPSDLPVICTEGKDINLTTIHIVIEIPVKINFVGVVYYKKHVDVDTASFYKN